MALKVTSCLRVCLKVEMRGAPGIVVVAVVLSSFWSVQMILCHAVVEAEAAQWRRQQQQAVPCQIGAQIMQNNVNLHLFHEIVPWYPYCTIPQQWNLCADNIWKYMACLSKNVEDDQNLYCSKNWIHHFNVFSWEPPKPPPPAVPPAQALLRLRIIVDEGKIQEVHQPVATKSCCFLRQFKAMWFHLWFHHVSFPTKQWSNGKPGVFYVREMGWVNFLWICVRTHENQFDGRTKDLWFSYHHDISASFDVLDYWHTMAHS